MSDLLQLYKNAYLVYADEIVAKIKKGAYQQAKEYPGIIFFVSEKHYIHNRVAEAVERKLKNFYEPEDFKVSMIYESKETDICTHVLVKYQIVWS